MIGRIGLVLLLAVCAKAGVPAAPDSSQKKRTLPARNTAQPDTGTDCQRAHAEYVSVLKERSKCARTEDCKFYSGDQYMGPGLSCPVYVNRKADVGDLERLRNTLASCGQSAILLSPRRADLPRRSMHGSAQRSTKKATGCKQVGPAGMKPRPQRHAWFSILARDPAGAGVPFAHAIIGEHPDIEGVRGYWWRVDDG